jgi:RHS repeat-associated protein
VQSYEYDAGDRLVGPTYDGWGRITKLPGADAGGKELVTSSFGSNMVATQTQGTVTNTFQLDASGRQRAREQAGGVAGLEIFHYDGPSDSVAWTELGTTWSRNISGIGGELAAVQESSGTTTFKLTNLHGDVVASASSSPTAMKLLATYRSDEFGEPVSGSSGRYGWLGGKSRRTELSSGVVQMGARSYIPSLGRFLTPDPVPGGSANAYDYADQDPVNVFDLAGECTSGPHRTCRGHNKTGPTGETRHEARRLSRREHQTVVKDLRSGTRISFVISHQVTRSDVNRAVRNALAEVDNAPHMGVPFAEAVASRLGASVDPTTSGGGGPSACTVVGYAGDAVGITTGAAAIGASLFPPAGGTLVIVSGVSDLIGAAGDTLGKEGVC